MIYESMTKFNYYGKDIRVWRTETEFKLSYNNEDIYNLIRLNRQTERTVEELVEKILTLPGIAAIEVLTNGNGAVIYVEWP